MQGKVLKLFITRDDANKTRLCPTSITVDAKGVEEDKFYDKNDNRLILIASIYSYELAKSNGIEIEHGALGENILIDINPYSLIAGEKLYIGDITLEITQNCTLCKGLSSVDAKLPKLLKNDRGIFAKVVGDGGIINIGDDVKY